jgi:outer membrane receptor protein involved in Fe transport
MQRNTRVVVALVATALLFAAPALAQNPTGTLTGNVTDGAGVLPGVTVTVSSPSLQGTRVATTTQDGGYILKFLPPGEYKVRFELGGFQTIDTVVKVNAAQTQKLDATMPQTRIAEEVTVVGSLDTISRGTTSATTYDSKLINRLPVPRDLTNAVLLAPGVNYNGPGGAITMSGAQSYESLFLVNGVVVNENLRGQPLDLYVEDAVEETTTTTSGVSAEYGRFSGGVVNTLTKAGGNDFHASLRASLNNDKWTAKSPITVTREDKVNVTYEGTLGGYVLKDRLWFFLAGRSRNLKNAEQTYYTNIPYTSTSKLRRYEGKLTFSPTANHRLVGSYMGKQTDSGNYGFTPLMDLASLYDRQTPEDLQALNYSGVLSDQFFVEGQYSARHYTFQNAGSRYTDLDRGTVLWDLNNTGAFYHSPVFCAVCPGANEKRDNQDVILKGSLFLSSQRMGSHDIVFGVDRFQDKVDVNNYQSGSSYTLVDDNIIVRDGTIYPQFFGGSFSSLVVWWPIYSFSRGSDFRTDSAFVNDKWRLGDRWSFNLGARYDKNHSQDADGNVVSDDHKVSPRLGVSFDPFGDGSWLFDAAVAKYVTAIANTNNIAGGAAAAGSPSIVVWIYDGPTINPDPEAATLVSQGDAIMQVFAWFNSLTQEQKNALLVQNTVPGVSVRIPHSLASPSADEWTLGLTKRLGSGGMLRVDYINRKFHDFYVSRIDSTTGQGTDPLGNPYDIQYQENNNRVFRRSYDALQVQGSYRFRSNLSLGGNYTWSHLRGNYVGENLGSGPITPGDLQYPEYHRESWFNPDGDLPQDQRHRARVWLVWDIFNTRHNQLSASLLQSFDSGTPYGAVSTSGILISDYVTNPPPYASPPTTVNYWFTARDKYRTDNISSTDIAFNYSFKVPAFSSGLEFFVAPRLTNVFNQHGVINVNTTVRTAANPGRGLSPFNPFTDTPIECPQGAPASQCQSMGANWQLGPNFGKPLAATTGATYPYANGDFQMPRTFTVSMGVRF